MGSMGEEETGPLEATIKNLQREIDTKGQESGEMQRRWIAAQAELVALQVSRFCRFLGGFQLFGRLFFVGVSGAGGRGAGGAGGAAGDGVRASQFLNPFFGGRGFRCWGWRGGVQMWLVWRCE